MLDWLRELYATPLRLLASLMEIYTANRGRLKAWMAKPRVTRVFRALVLLTALAWLLIFLFAGDEHGERLDQAFKELGSYRPIPGEPPAPGEPGDAAAQ
jgi:hypothetical protein